ncbi:unnamed protein product, partial [Prorocentrum cordatum]
MVCTRSSSIVLPSGPTDHRLLSPRSPPPGTLFELWVRVLGDHVVVFPVRSECVLDAPFSSSSSPSSSLEPSGGLRWHNTGFASWLLEGASGASSDRYQVYY